MVSAIACELRYGRSRTTSYVNTDARVPLTYFPKRLHVQYTDGFPFFAGSSHNISSQDSENSSLPCIFHLRFKEEAC
jgi:hypothetical protein